MVVRIGSIEIGPGKPLVVIAGPCVIESWELLHNTASALKDMAHELGFACVFKSSYDKANRTSIDSFRGPGLTKGLEMLSEIKRKLGLMLLSDVHGAHECQSAAAVLDVLQIPAFLCRQTDLIVAAARTGRAVNVKKGQFVAPQEILNSVRKVTSSGNENVFVTERGTTFGYNNLVVDYRSIPIIQEMGCPVVFDATHSVQLPGGAGTSSSGQRQYVPTLAKAAIASGCSGLFMEVHPNPDVALSDAANQVPLNQVKDLISQCLKIHQVVQSLPELQLPKVGECMKSPFVARQAQSFQQV
ncbi:MAG: 3-deoxy-8-phosphooctulonate synthase [Candidatus Melainabacteria bacterium]|nr:3-deoxy-8-phosphooctulonate synthase [Candidatus Melainabacteria bacterium]